MIKVYTEELEVGLRDVNQHLVKMCGGRHLVSFNGNWAWTYEPQQNALRYWAADDAPEDAREMAEIIVDTWSYAPIVSMIPEPDPDGYGRSPAAWWCFDLWSEAERRYKQKKAV